MSTADEWQVLRALGKAHQDPTEPFRTVLLRSFRDLCHLESITCVHSQWGYLCHQAGFQSWPRKQGTIFRSNNIYLGRRKYYWSLKLIRASEGGSRKQPSYLSTACGLAESCLSLDRASHPPCRSPNSSSVTPGLGLALISPSLVLPSLRLTSPLPHMDVKSLLSGIS